MRPDRPILPTTKSAAAATDLLVGITAGLAAAAAMDLFHAIVAKAFDQAGWGETAETKAGDAACELVSGKPVKGSVRKTADSVVRYATGAVMGGVYGLLGGMLPDLIAVNGVVYGAVTWLVADEMAVPLLGLAPQPGRTKLRDHVFGFASHLIFGLTLDWSRRRLNRALAVRR